MRSQVSIRIAALLVLTLVAWRTEASADSTASAPAPSSASPASATASVESLARDNPLSLLAMARSRCDQQVHDYRCIFTKKEFVGGEMRGPTVMQVLLRNEPLSVLMTLRSNSTIIKRALYVRGARFDDQGQELMLVEPAGWRRLLVSKAEIPIHDERILEHNRSSIENFGFMAALDRLHQVSETAYRAGVLELSYEGRGRVDGRPTLILVRLLPYDAENGVYPDALTIVHLDEEWLLPVFVEHYADPQKRQLLASYQVTQVRLNPGLKDADFKF